MGRKLYQRYEQTQGLSPQEAKIYRDLQNVARIEYQEPVGGGAGAWRDHLGMALGSVSLCALATFVGVTTVGWWQSRDLAISADAGGSVALLVFSIGLFGMVIKAVLDYWKGLSSRERLYKQEGEPKKEARSTQLTVTIEGKGREMDLDLPIDEKVLLAFAQAAVGRMSLGERAWKDWMTPDEYNGLRDKLMGKGLARWKNPTSRQQGWELTDSGLELMTKLARGDYDALETPGG